MLIALAGAPNKGKSTLFNALTSGSAAVADYPFTTIDPNKGVAFVTAPCPHAEINSVCHPLNGSCANGVRRIPINVIDVAGLVPGAHAGRGMGNQFLSDVASADAIIVVSDASCGTDSEGNHADNVIVGRDVTDIVAELEAWFAKLLEKHAGRCHTLEELAAKLTGINVTEAQLKAAVAKAGVADNVAAWHEKQFLEVAKHLLPESKPIVVAANKCDLPLAKENLAKYDLPYPVIATSADSEVALQRASAKGLVGYDGKTITRKQELPPALDGAVKKLEALVAEWGSTGVDALLRQIVFEKLGLIVVYPVEDENKWCDSKGNVLPHSILLPKGGTAVDLAAKIHSDLAKGFLYALDGRTKMRLSKDTSLKAGDVVKIVSSR